MRLVESVRVRWFLVLASVAFAGSAVAVIATCPDKGMKETIRVEKSKAKKIGKCRQQLTKRLEAAAPVKPEVKPRGAQYRDIIKAAEPALNKCIAPKVGNTSGISANGDVSYKVTVTVDRAGRAKNVEVKGSSADLRKVSMKAVGCVEKVMGGLTFPRGDNEARVSVNLTLPIIY
jgi:hypothetical protein